MFHAAAWATEQEHSPAQRNASIKKHLAATQVFNLYCNSLLTVWLYRGKLQDFIVGPWGQIFRFKTNGTTTSIMHNVSNTLVPHVAVQYISTGTPAGCCLYSSGYKIRSDYMEVSSLTFLELSDLLWGNFGVESNFFAALVKLCLEVAIVGERELKGFNLRRSC